MEVFTTGTGLNKNSLQTYFEEITLKIAVSKYKSFMVTQYIQEVTELLPISTTILSELSFGLFLFQSTHPLPTLLLEKNSSVFTPYSFFDSKILYTLI